jgi:23S rRNA-/tRNA-specific pseudouridylate synthase
MFLAARLSISKRAAKNLLDDRVVWVNRRCVWMTHHALKTGDTVELPATSLPKQSAAPSVPVLRILVQDDFYLVADKPSNMLSVGAGSAEELLARARPASPRSRRCNRLDRDTTGCLLFAKSAAAFDAAVAVFKTRRVSKLYRAIVYGRYERTVSTVDQELDGERAVSHIQREAIAKDASFLKVKIETGRTHQIRRHLAALRHPVLGEPRTRVKIARGSPPVRCRARCSTRRPGAAAPPARGETLKAHSPLPPISALPETVRHG